MREDTTAAASKSRILMQKISHCSKFVNGYRVRFTDMDGLLATGRTGEKARFRHCTAPPPG